MSKAMDAFLAQRAAEQRLEICQQEAAKTAARAEAAKAELAEARSAITTLRAELAEAKATHEVTAEKLNSYIHALATESDALAAANARIGELEAGERAEAKLKAVLDAVGDDPRARAALQSCDAPAKTESGPAEETV